MEYPYCSCKLTRVRSTLLQETLLIHAVGLWMAPVPIDSYRVQYCVGSGEWQDIGGDDDNRDLEARAPPPSPHVIASTSLPLSFRLRAACSVHPHTQRRRRRRRRRRRPCRH